MKHEKWWDTVGKIFSNHHLHKTVRYGISKRGWDAALKLGTQPTSTNKAMFQFLCDMRSYLEGRPPLVDGAGDLIELIDEVLAQQKQ